MSAATETRIQASLLAALEKRCLIWIAKRLPDGVNSDHLTALGAVSMLGAGACYWLGAQYPAALVAAVVCLALNWFGDSLDGTLARVRHQERPRYGFYVDHVLDVVGIVLLFGGLVAGGFMTPIIGAGFLLAYCLLSTEIALATHTVGTFKICVLEDGTDRAPDPDGRRHSAAAPFAGGLNTRHPLPALRRRRRRRHSRAAGHVRRLERRQYAHSLSSGAAAAACRPHGDSAAGGAAEAAPDECHVVARSFSSAKSRL